MNRRLHIVFQNWWGGALSGCVVPALILLATATGAQAVPILPPPISYEYIGLNFADNIATSSTIGTLNYTGGPGCGGICTATSEVGGDPLVSLNINAVVFDNTGGGGATVMLAYYTEYVAPPGLYNVQMFGPESLSITDGLSNAFAYVAIGPGDQAGTFNDFNSYIFQAADCVNFGCQDIPAANLTPAPFTPLQTLQIFANTPYFVLLDLEIRPSTSGVQSMATIDPQFSTTDTSGYFVYSAGVTDPVASPEPGALVLMLSGLTVLGGLRALTRDR